MVFLKPMWNAYGIDHAKTSRYEHNFNLPYDRSEKKRQNWRTPFAAKWRKYITAINAAAVSSNFVYDRLHATRRRPLEVPSP